MRWMIFVAAATLLGGCAEYEYDLTQPPGMAGHISSDQQTVIKTDTLEYHLQSYDSRLVMQIYNPTAGPIQLLGGQSSVVDPDGQSHPLHDQTIAPGSYIKLIFPPFRPVIEPTGPSFEWGVGVGVEHRISYFYDDDRPRYLVLDDGADVYYWEWTGPGDLRVTLVFRRGDQTFQQMFTFHRVKE